MKEERSCKTCKYEDSADFDKPCLVCSSAANFNKWEKKE